MSAKRYGCILNYAPGIDGYNYLPFLQLMMSNDEVYDERCAFDQELVESRTNRIQTISDDLWNWKHDIQQGSITDVEPLPQYKLRDTFFDEHERFIERLELDNKTGLNVFYFDVEYMPTKYGGSCIFRNRRTENRRTPFIKNQ